MTSHSYAVKERRISSIYIKISCLSVDWRHVCVSTDVMFVDWCHYKDWALCRHEVVCQLTSYLSTDKITDRDTGTQMATGTPGHREYKWRPGHSKRNYRLGHRDTNNDRETGNINDDRETGTQLQRGCRSRDTGNVRLTITVNKAQGQSLE